MISSQELATIRADFPFFEERRGGTPLIYLDSACMALKPVQVVQAMQRYYYQFPGCAGRSAHYVAERVEREIVIARKKIGGFIGGRSEEIIFTRNTTEGINLLVNSLGLQKGDEVLISDKEHNSNLIPWLRARDTMGIRVKIVRTEEDGTFDLEGLTESITDRTAFASFVHTSNLDGVSNPVSEISKICHERQVRIHFDAAQAVPHKSVSVRDIHCDFLTFSGHKMLGPSGIGALWGSEEGLASLTPFLLGGETVTTSSLTGYTLEKVPERFEAGLQDYAGIIGFGEAASYLQKIGMGRVMAHESKLNELLTEGLQEYDRVTILGPQDFRQRGSIVSFLVDDVSSHEVAGLLSSSANICVRSGMHCVHSWFNEKGIAGSVRASFGVYNSPAEVGLFLDAFAKVMSII